MLETADGRRVTVDFGRKVKTAFACLAALLAAGCVNHPPQRDVFVPPYAEKGCWARLYAAPGFAGDMRQLEGPIYAEAIHELPLDVPGSAQAPPQPLLSEFKSLRVGPHARIVGFAQTLFREPVTELPAGAERTDLGAQGFHERVQSLAMHCQAHPGTPPPSTAQVLQGR